MRRKVFFLILLGFVLGAVPAFLYLLAGGPALRAASPIAGVLAGAVVTAIASFHHDRWIKMIAPTIIGMALWVTAGYFLDHRDLYPACLGITGLVLSFAIRLGRFSGIYGY